MCERNSIKQNTSLSYTTTCRLSCIGQFPNWASKPILDLQYNYSRGNGETVFFTPKPLSYLNRPWRGGGRHVSGCGGKMDTTSVVHGLDFQKFTKNFSLKLACQSGRAPNNPKQILLCQIFGDRIFKKSKKLMTKLWAPIEPKYSSFFFFWGWIDKTLENFFYILVLWAQKPYQILRHNNQTWSVMLCWTTIAGDTVGETENTSKAKFTDKHLQPWKGHCDHSLQPTLSFEEYTVLNLEGDARNPFILQHVLVLQSNKRKSKSETTPEANFSNCQINFYHNFFQ